MPAEENLSGTEPSPPICAAEDALVLSWQSWLAATETVWLAELKLSNYYLALHRKELAEPCSGDPVQDTPSSYSTGSCVYWLQK